MFIDALTPAEPVPTTDPKSEHSNPHLGTSSANNDVHARVHGDGASCPVCTHQINAPTAAFPSPADEVAAASVATASVAAHRR